MSSPTIETIPTTTGGRSTGPLLSLLLCAVAAIAVAVVAVGPILVFGALAGLALLAVCLRFPVFALTLPVLCAPVALTPLPAAPQAQVLHLAAAAGIGSVAVNVLLGRLRARPPWPALAAAGILIALLISSMLSEDPLRGLTATANHMLGVGLAIAIGTVVVSDRAAATWLLRGWAAGTLLVTLPAIPAALEASSSFSGAAVGNRVQGVFAQPNDFGEFGLMGFVTAAALLARPRITADRWLAGVSLAVSTLGIVASFSRGTWIGMAVFFVALVILRPQLLRLVAGGAAAILALIGLGGALGIPPFPTVVERLGNLLNTGANPDDDRSLIYGQAFELFQHNPFVGVGPAAYANAAAAPGTDFVARSYLHGHSVPLTVAAEVGLLGLLALGLVSAVFCVSVLRGLRQSGRIGRIRTRTQLAVLGSGMVAVAAHGLIEVVYTNPFLIMLGWSLFGLTAGLAARAQHNPTPKPE